MDWHKAFEHARFRGLKHEDCEDFASYACSVYMTRQSSTLQQLLIDYLRLTYGSTRSSSGKARQAETHRWGDVDVDRVIVKNDEDEESRSKTRMIFHVANQFDTIDRACIILMCHYGFKLIELAALFGVNDTRISQRVKRINDKISKMSVGGEFQFGSLEHEMSDILDPEYKKVH